jgi:hypothetical protein
MNNSTSIGYKGKGASGTDLTSIKRKLAEARGYSPTDKKRGSTPVTDLISFRPTFNTYSQIVGSPVESSLSEDGVVTFDFKDYFSRGIPYVVLDPYGKQLPFPFRPSSIPPYRTIPNGKIVIRGLNIPGFIFFVIMGLKPTPSSLPSVQITNTTSSYRAKLEMDANGILYLGVENINANPILFLPSRQTEITVTFGGPISFRAFQFVISK